ncbi:MAG: CsgG/HfaB family protein [Pseudomonadota bacterium]
MRRFKTLTIAAIFAGLLSGCAAHSPKMWEPAKAPKATPVTTKLNALPPSGQRAAVAVYNFTDQTGQFKPTDGAQTLSRAVTQGATSILVKTLHEAGNRSWFTVVERERLENLLRERAVIREMRASYLGETKINPQALPPLLFAGVLLEGGIIGYDSNTKTGGSGARLLGIGGRTQYREDTVTVYLRAVSVKTGEVLASVSSRKSIASVGVGADAFRFVAFRELLELEAGVTYNEPDELALRQAIEASVYSLIMEGAMQDLWCFNASEQEVSSLLTEYIADRDSISKSKVVLPRPSNGAAVAGLCGAQKVARQSIQQARQTPAVGESPAQPKASAAPAANQDLPKKQQSLMQDSNVRLTPTAQVSDGQTFTPVAMRVPLKKTSTAPAFVPAQGASLATVDRGKVARPAVDQIGAMTLAQWSEDGLDQCKVIDLDRMTATDLLAELGRRFVSSGSAWVESSGAFADFALANGRSSAAIRVPLLRDGAINQPKHAYQTIRSGRSIRDVTITALEDDSEIQSQPFGSIAMALGGWLNSFFEGEEETVRVQLRRS